MGEKSTDMEAEEMLRESTLLVMKHIRQGALRGKGIVRDDCG